MRAPRCSTRCARWITSAAATCLSSAAARSATAGRPASGCFGLEAQGDWADLSNPRVSVRYPGVSTRTKTNGIGLFTGQVGYAWNASLFYVKGGAAVTSNRFSILETLTGIELVSASGPAGVAPWVSDRSTASRRIGPWVSNTTICSWVTRIIRSRSSIRLVPLFSTIGSARTWIWSPCASTTASAVTVTAARSSRNTDRALLLRLLQQTGPAEMPAFLLEGCLKDQTGDPTAADRRQAAADCIIQALEKSDIAEPCQAIGAALPHLGSCAPIRD